jgi:hypothetical protein
MELVASILGAGKQAKKESRIFLSFLVYYSILKMMALVPLKLL